MKSIVLSYFVSLMIFSSSYAKPHSHSSRAHEHPLPTQGVAHRHGTGAVGKSNINKPIVKKQQTNLETKKLYIGTEIGTEYIGQVRNGKPHGKGTLYLPNGSKIIGSFINNKISGPVTILFANGNKYVGTFYADLAQEAVSESGKGTIYNKNGTKITGTFKNFNIVGVATIHFNNGNKYVGTFKDNKPHGRGTVYQQNGTKIIGIFKRGKMVKKLK